MNRRFALGCLFAGVKTTVVASLAMATEQASRTIQRIAGPRWNVNGDWNPSPEAIRSHLRDSHGIDPSGLSLDQMLTLHDNDHNRMGHRHGHGQQESGKRPAKGYRKA